MENKKNDFVRETIKDKPVNKKRIWQKLCVSAGCALVFALIFCIIAILAFPKVLEMTGYKLVKDVETQTPPPITIPEIEDTGATTEVIVPEFQPGELTIENYQKIQSQLYGIGTTANRSIVTIHSVTSQTDWFNETYSSEGVGSGVIVGETANAFLIMTESKLITNANSLSVSFIDDSEVPAEIKGMDANTGLAILSVAKRDVTEATLARISVATLSKYIVTPGTIVIALGSPLGSPYSILTGTVTATDQTVSLSDCTYKLLSTDISSNTSGTGVVINTNGEIVGVIMQDYNVAKEENTITAVPVSEIATVIETISSGASVPYIGLGLITVPGDINKQEGVPFGAYIKTIDEGSPAALASLQLGDVVVELDGQAITSVTGYTNALLDCAPGDTVSLVVARRGSNGYTEIEYEITIGEK